jgi:hypothetical protein
VANPLCSLITVHLKTYHQEATEGSAFVMQQTHSADDGACSTRYVEPAVDTLPLHDTGDLAGGLASTHVDVMTAHSQ